MGEKRQQEQQMSVCDVAWKGFFFICCFLFATQGFPPSKGYIFVRNLIHFFRKLFQQE